ncbi:MAG: FAD:protein FMN transferase [Holophaga sp.]|nr:FAD:protein FMN transferase [Holophaga sp.]
MRPVLFLLTTTPALIAQTMPTERQVLAMGTRFSLRLETGGRAEEAALAEVARIEAACSTWRPDSAWSRLNAAQGEAVALDPEWISLLTRVQSWSRATSGAFDPVLRALMQAWGIRQGGRVPDGAELAAARTASGSALLQLDEIRGTARLSHPHAGLEEGGFLKGYALDAARLAAQREGSTSGLLDLGGQILVWGTALPVDVAHPRQRQWALLRIVLANASLSTSGCSERGRHLLDPRTGKPCPDWGAVSVVCPSALDADVLSTALYVMGPDQGLAWAEAHRFAAVFMPHQGPLQMTTAFRAFNPTHF